MRLRASSIVVVWTPFALLAACAEPAPPAASAPVAPAASAAPAATPEAASPAETAQPAPATPSAAASAAPPAPASAAPAASSNAAPAAAPAAASHSGEAVYYDANGRGACSLTFGKNASVLSAPNVVYNKIESCGQCLEVTGPAGSAVIQVVDRCNTCADDLLVINKPAFDKIAGTASSGREKITWKQVPCDVSGNLELRIKKSSSAYWTAIQIRNHRLPIRAVSFKQGDKWVPMTRSNDNYFVAEKGVGAGGLTLRIEANDGQVVEETLDKWKDGETYQGKTQLK